MTESLSYVLPLRWHDDDGRLGELTRYLDWLSSRCEVIVVDGSPDPLFERHAAAWAGRVVHCRPDPDLRFLNGKVNGVITGVRRTTSDTVVLADDDVRYDADSLEAVAAALDESDLVIPQNVFSGWPWHARWDNARSLLNRAFGNDYPGTLGVRRSAFGDGYDGDVLFENLELIRTVAASGGRIRSLPGLFVRRLPPSASGFRSQRVRQAYDSLAQPARLAVELAVLPVTGAVAWRFGWIGLAATAGLTIVVAEVGRRRHGGRTVYPVTAALWAPLWVAERGVCSWLAFWQRTVRGGVGYAGNRITVAAHSRRHLTRNRLTTGERGVRCPEHGIASGHAARRRTA
jgi:hypothetical protein